LGGCGSASAPKPPTPNPQSPINNLIFNIKIN